MQSIQVEIDSDLANLLQQLNQPIQQSVREFMVLELYRRGHISSGKSAELLNMTRWAFIEYASRLGVPFFDMSKEEWDNELAQSLKI